MLQPIGLGKGNALSKLSSAGLILRAAAITVGTIWVTSIDLSNPVEAQARLREQIINFRAVSLLVTFGRWAVMAGAAGIYRSINTPGAAWARLGLYIMIVGTTLWILGMSLV